MQRKKESPKVRRWLAGLALLVAATVSVTAGAQVIFQRERLLISPPPVTRISVAEGEEEKAQVPPESPRPAQEFLVEVRSEEALNLEYIHTLNDLGENSGVMIGFAIPSIVSLPNMKVYSAVDVLFVDEDGVIVQILPDIVPAEINRDIAASTPVSAFLYLKAGESKRRDIRPRDIVTHGLFSAKPVILK